MAMPRRTISRRSMIQAAMPAAVVLSARGAWALQDTASKAVRPPAPKLSREQQAAFLRTAEVIRTRPVSTGVTGTLRATLKSEDLTHDASVQTIDEFRQQFKGQMGTEYNFKDTWKFNVAAYLLDQMLGLNMTPVAVQRTHGGRTGSFCWWVDNVIMDEEERRRRDARPPDLKAWSDQIHIVRVFDQLIYNTDRNLGNMLIDKDWQVWMIDHSRAFRMYRDLREPQKLERCDTDLLERMKGLTESGLREAAGIYVNGLERDGLLARRDLIVELFEKKGKDALYSSPRRP